MSSPVKMAADMQAASSNSVSGGDHCISDDSVEYGCSICLEPFNSLDPPMVTECMHEYHFQCILECQELLNHGGKSEKDLRHNLCFVDRDTDVNNDFPREDDPGFEQQIMRHFTAVARRARNMSIRKRQTTPDIGHSQILPSVPVPNMSHMTRASISLEVHQNQASYLPNFDPAVSAKAPTATRRASSLNIPSFGDSPALTSEKIQYSDEFSESPHNNPRRSSSSEFLAFSESLKSKISNASSRYKESISSSTRFLKEKFIAQKGFVKELSRDVQRETSAGVALMVDRLDFSMKRASFSTGNSKSPHEANEENSMVQSANQNIKELCMRRP